MRAYIMLNGLKQTFSELFIHNFSKPLFINVIRREVKIECPLPLIVSYDEVQASDFKQCGMVDNIVCANVRPFETYITDAAYALAKFFVSDLVLPFQPARQTLAVQKSRIDTTCKE